MAARNTEIDEDTYQIEQLQITNPEVIPRGVRCEGLSGPVIDELSNHYEGCLSLHTVPIEGRDIRDDPIATEHALQQVLIEMKPTQGQGNVEGGRIIRTLLAAVGECRASTTAEQRPTRGTDQCHVPI